MPRIGKSLITPPQELIDLINAASRKNIKHVSLVRGLESNRALDWIARFSTVKNREESELIENSGSISKDIDSIGIFHDGAPTDKARIYVGRELSTVTLEDVAAWIDSQPDGFEDSNFHPLVNQAVSNGWTVSIEYSDHSRLRTKLKDHEIPDMIELRAEAHNFNKPRHSSVQVWASTNEGEPDWNNYMTSPSDSSIHGPMPHNIKIDEIQELLGNLAPTLPKPKV